MDDIHSILVSHKEKKFKPHNLGPKDASQMPVASTSEIPDLFFDDILIRFKLSRIQVLILMHLYRLVWCKPNVYQEYGLTQILSVAEICQKFGLSLDEYHQTIKSLESFGFIETMRVGQYFVRKYFTRENDNFYGQFYDSF